MRAKIFTTISLLGLTLLVSACSPKPENQDTAPSSEAAPPMDGMGDMSGMSGMAMEADAKTGSGTGTITEIDKTAGTVTISHEPIPAVGWPAMTMAFKAGPEILSNAKVGQSISFDVSVKGSDTEVTAIRAKN
ncbi:copper-binding protein [Asticcacaulis biprosthecium]|nr:copper-binding protein [Asticcacaulis biprosthecium]